METYENKRHVLPHEANLGSAALINLSLRDTPFLELLQLSTPFKIPVEVRNEHLLCIARTGSGKTQLIQRDILDNLTRPEGPGMVVIDSQNQMIPKLEKLQVARD